MVESNIYHDSYLGLSRMRACKTDHNARVTPSTRPGFRRISGCQAHGKSLGPQQMGVRFHQRPSSTDIQGPISSMRSNSQLELSTQKLKLHAYSSRTLRPYAPWPTLRDRRWIDGLWPRDWLVQCCGRPSPGRGQKTEEVAPAAG